MATNDLLSRYKKQKKAEAEKDITHNNSTSDSPFTLSKYREMKKNNQVNYDTQIVNDWFNNADKYMTSVSENTSTQPAYNWINENSQFYADNFSDLLSHSDYVRTYINSLKGTEQYDSLQKQFDSYNENLRNYKDYLSGLKDFASKFNDEEHYNNAVNNIENSETELEKGSKYAAYVSGGKSFDDKKISDFLSNPDSISNPKDFASGLQNLDNGNGTLKYWETQDRLSDVKNVDTVPTKEQFAQYQEDSDMLFNQDMEEKYGVSDYDYDKLVKAYNSTDDYREKEWLLNRIKESASSKELEDWKKDLEDTYNADIEDIKNDGTKDKGVQYSQRKKAFDDDISEIERLIEEKREQENEEKYYYDIVENDVKAATVIQKYYKLNEFNKNGTSYKSANADEAVKYPEMGEKSQNERTKIEQDFYNLEKKGYDTEKLLKYYSRIKEREEAEEDLEYLRNQADKYPISSSFGSMIMNTYGSIPDTVNYIGAGVDKAFGGDGYINPDSTNVAKAQVIREKVSEDMDGLGKFFYNTGMSIGDNLARMPLLALPGGKAMSLALAGTSAGVSSANDVINSGGSIESALLTGAAAGTAEVVFEKISLDKLIDLRKQGTDSVFRAVINQMKTEGLEEVGTDIANAITDQIINGDMSQLSLQYQNYIAQGYSEEEARKQIAFDFASQLGQSFAAGAISGGVLGGGAIGINYATNKADGSVVNKQVGKAVKENENVTSLIDTAKKLSPESKAYKIAVQLEEQQKNNKKVSSSKVGQLRSLIIEQSQSEFDAEYKKVTENLHEEEKAVVDKLLNREALSEDEVKILNDNDVLKNSIADVQKKFNNLYSSAETADKAPFESIKSIDDNTDKIDESKLKVSEDGETKVNDEVYDGAMEVVRTNPFAETVTYKMEKNGEVIEVNSENIEFRTKKEAKLNALASKYDVQTAQKFFDLYESGQDVDEYSREFNIYQNYGRLAVPLDSEKLNVGYLLDNDQKTGAYEAGLTSRKSYYQEQNIISSNARNSKYYAYTKGKFNASAIKGIQLDETQRAFYNFFREFALRTGINVELFSSKEKSGKYQGEQGSWDKNTKTIRVDINAGLMSVNDRGEIKHGMLNTFSHELTHIAESSGFYDELHEAIVSALEKRGTDFNELVKAKKDEMLRTDPKAKTMSDEKLTYLADVEVIANNCETMLKNSKIFEDIAQGNPTLAQKIKDKLKNFIARLKQLLNKTNALTHEGKLLEECVTEFEEIQKLWDKAVTDGIKTANAMHAEQKNNTADNSDVKNQSRKSELDNEYLEAVKNNDLETAQNLVDEYAVSKGFKYRRCTPQYLVPHNYVPWMMFVEAEDNNSLHQFGDYNFAAHDRGAVDIEDIKDEIQKLALEYYGTELEDVVINPPDIVDSAGMFDDMDFIQFLWDNYFEKSYEESGEIPAIKTEDGLIVFYDDYNRIKSADPITYDDNGNVIPLSERFKNEKVDIRYQSRNTEADIDYSDLTTLDDEEIKVYNKRGWTRELFTAEDKLLLEERYNLLLKNNNSSTYRFSDGSILTEVNNKMVVISGRKENPVIEAVIVINAKKEYEAEWIKELIYDEQRKFRYSKEDFSENMEFCEHSYAKELFKTYISNDYRYRKGYKRNFRRATLPSDFKSYGYTQQFHVGEGDNRETEQGISKNGVNDNIEYQQRYVEPASTALDERLQGDELLDAQDIIDTIKSVNGKVDEYGNAILYHGTNKNSRDSIYQSGKMIAKEDGLFFSTKPDGEIKGYGDNIVRVKIPVEYLELNDIFNGEAHFRLPLNSDYSANVSSVLFQMRPNDDYFFDDLFDDDGIVEQSVFEKAVKDNPDSTLMAVYQHAAITAQTAITQSNDVRLDEKAYLRVARKIMQEYDISRKLNKDFDTELAEKIRMHIGRIENGVADFESELDSIVKDCQEALLFSGHLDYESKQDERDFVFGLINGKRLLVTKNGESVIKEEYGSIRNYQRKMFGHMYVTLESNLHKKKNFSKDGLYISDIISSVGEQYENLLHIDENADDDVGYLWLDNLVNNYLEPQLVNHYIDGFYENLDTAALEMAFDITTEIINAKASQAVSSSKPNHRRIRQLANAKKQANSEQKAVQSAKLESYKKQLNGSEVSDSNRHILADLLTDSAQNEEESNIITSYKSEIDTLDTLEERLYEINKKIKEISFKKGSDRSQLANLKEQQKNLKNKIERKDKQLLKLESMDIMKKLINSEKQKASAKSAEKVRSKYQQKLKDEREKHNAELASVKERDRERLAKTIESKDKIIVAEREKRKTMVKGIRKARDKKEIIRKTIKKIKVIDKLLNRSKADKTVKQGLRDTASKLLSLKDILLDTNLSNADIVRRGVETATPEEQKLLDEYLSIIGDTDTELTEAQRRKVYQLNSKLKDLFIRERERLNRATVKQALTELSETYKSVENAPEAYLRNSFDKNIIEVIDNFKEEIGGTLVKDMNVEQVQKLHDIVTMTLTSIRNANKHFAENIKTTCEETSNNVMNEILSVKGTKEIRNLLANKILDFQWRNLKPIYAFRLMGSKTFEKIYWNLQKGELDWYIDLAEAKKFKEGCEEKYGYKSFDFKKTFEFTAMDDSIFILDLNQMMDIYAASRRPQALQHLLKGGFTFEKDSADGKLKVKTGAKAYPLTIGTIQSIANGLSENEKGYAEAMQKYLSEVMAKKGNEVSMALYGVEMFNEDTYWSISSSDTFLKVEENETTGEFKVKNSGFTKSTIRNASNPIVLRGFEENWCNHVNQMSLYHAMTLPLEDFTKVFNYNTGVRTSEENPTAVTGVRSVIKGAFGNAAEHYFRQFICDLNGGIREASRVGIADNMIALSKKAAVFANFSVFLQQPSAIFRAMSYVNARYFLPEPNKLVRLQNHRKDWEQLKKYAPIAGIKEMGMFDTGTGKGVLEWLSSGKRDSVVKKTQNKIDDVGSWLPAKADEYAWVKLWHAIQRETQVKYGLAIGTEENLVKSGERFNEVVHLTQVYDSVFSRSGAMRSSQTFDKMATSFMAEPTTIMNMAVDAAIQLKRNGKSGIKQFAKSASAILISILANTLLKSIATAGRDDDEDETYGDKYLQAFCTDLINSAIPLNYYPIMRDLLSVIEGYTTERMDMSLVSDFVVSLKKLLKEDGATANNLIDFVGYIANLFGLPMRNVVRDFRAVFNTYNTLTTASKDPITSLEMSMPTDYQEAYDKYWKEGYTEEDCEIKAATSVKSKIRKKLRPVYLEALKNQDSATVANIRRYMRDSGFYKSLNDVDEALKGWRKSSDEEEKRTQRAEERK